jgi:pimeloyl-ACP methyl ester carboxylesterase
MTREASDPTMRTFYLRTEPDPAMVIAHMPGDESARSSRGVIICPPLAWDDLCTYRARRTWAETLAAAGHPTLRLDLPGVGDSGGSSFSPSRLDAWVNAVTVAVRWLRDEAGCDRVAGIGVGFGGMLAWLAAARGAEIDDLALWAVPMRGRQLVRELRAGAMLTIDRRVFLGPDGSESPEEDAVDGMLDEAGQVITTETIAELSAIDLAGLELPDAAGRAVLLLERPGVQADADLRDHLLATGADLSLGPGDEYGAMMQYVQESQTPLQAIDASLRWLGATPPARSEPAGPSVAGSGELIQPEIVLDGGGATVRERPIAVTLSAGEMVGIVTEPTGGRGAGLTAIFFGGGSDRRIGPNRMWVDAARRWAARGVTCVRLDLPGIGDAPGDERRWDRLASHYNPAMVDLTVELLDALVEAGLPREFILAGFCSGGYRSIHTAARDARVRGAIAISLPYARWTWWTVNVRDSWLLIWSPRPGDSKAKIATARTLRRILLVLRWCQARLLEIMQGRRSPGERVIDQVCARGTELTLIARRDSYTSDELRLPRRKARLDRYRTLHLTVMPNKDERFRPLSVQRWVSNELDAGIGRAVAPR